METIVNHFSTAPKYEEGKLYKITPSFISENGDRIIYCTKSGDRLYGFTIYCEKNKGLIGNCNNGNFYNSSAWEEFHGELIFRQK